MESNSYMYIKTKLCCKTRSAGKTYIWNSTCLITYLEHTQLPWGRTSLIKWNPFDYQVSQNCWPAVSGGRLHKPAAVRCHTTGSTSVHHWTKAFMYYTKEGKGCWRGVWQFGQLLTAIWHRYPLHQKGFNEQCLQPAQWWWLWTPDNTAIFEVLCDCECHNFVYKWIWTVQKPPQLPNGRVYLSSSANEFTSNSRFHADQTVILHFVWTAICR